MRHMKLETHEKYTRVFAQHDGAWIEVEDFTGPQHPMDAQKFAENLDEDATSRQAYIDMALD